MLRLAAKRDIDVVDAGTASGITSSVHDVWVAVQFIIRLSFVSGEREVGIVEFGKHKFGFSLGC